MVAPLRIVYFGTPDFAVPPLRALLASPHPVVAVISQPDRPKGRGHRVVPTATRVVATEAGVQVLQPDRIRDEAFLAEVASLAADLGVVAAYGRILPEALLAIPRYGMINVHASILPRWRGAAPVHRAVIAGDRETGVTIMSVVKALDAGAAFTTVTRPIGPDETSADVERALAELGAGALLETVDAIAAGTAVETPQDDARATYAAKLTREDGVADWTLPAQRLHDLVRGLQPWPLVRIALGGVRVALLRTAVDDATDQAPGTIVQSTGGALSIAAGDGRRLQVLRLQPEGRREMTTREFLAGHRVEAGTRVGEA